MAAPALPQGATFTDALTVSFLRYPGWAAANVAAQFLRVQRVPNIQADPPITANRPQVFLMPRNVLAKGSNQTPDSGAMTIKGYNQSQTAINQALLAKMMSSHLLGAP